MYTNHRIKYDQVGPFCYLIYPETGQSFVLKLGFYLIFKSLPTVIGIIVTVICYRLAARRVKRVSVILFNVNQVDTSRLLWYPIALFATATPFLILSFIQSCGSSTPSIELQTFGFGVCHLIGFMNALVYGVQKSCYQSQNNSRESKGPLLEIPCDNSNL